MSPLNSCVDIAGPAVIVVGIDVVLVVGRDRNRLVGSRASITMVGRMRQVSSLVAVVAAMAVAVAVSTSIARVAGMITITGVGAVSAILVAVTAAAVAVRRRCRVEHCGGLLVASCVVMVSLLRGMI